MLRLERLFTTFIIAIILINVIEPTANVNAMGFTSDASSALLQDNSPTEVSSTQPSTIQAGRLSQG